MKVKRKLNRGKKTAFDVFHYIIKFMCALKTKLEYNNKTSIETNNETSPDIRII